MRALGERLDRLAAQRAALPSERLAQLDDINARTITLTERRAELQARLEQLPEPTRNLLGRVRDPSVVDRVRLVSAIAGCERQLADTRDEQATLHQRLGDVESIRREVDGLDRAIATLTSERGKLRDELVDREMRDPGDWVRVTLGQAPTTPAGRRTWEHGVRALARYRLDHDVTDQTSALGEPPVERDERRAYDRAADTLAETERRLGREPSHERGSDLGIER